MIYKILCSLAIFAALHSKASADATKFAVSLFDNQLGAKIMVFQGYTTADCKTLIDLFFSALLADCPQCKKVDETCVTSSDMFKDVWDNKKYVLPYFSAGNIRIIMVGLPRAELRDWCHEMAKDYKGPDRTPVCIE